MAKNFQRDRNKIKNQCDIYNPEFATSINVISNEEREKFNEMVEKCYYIASFFRWFPDLFLDAMTPPDSKRRLNLYQRVLLRSLFRFPKTYTTIPRGSAKSFMQLLCYLLMAVMFPNIKLSITAETKEQSASIIKDKYTEITEEWFPFFKDEIATTSFQKDMAIIVFHSGSRIDNLANAQTSKGQRRHRGGVDESARLNNTIFKDAIEPIFSLKRWTTGDEIDPYELNGQFAFFTTSGFKGTEEYTRSNNFADDMANLNGKFVFGANWELPVHFGLLTKKYVMDIKEDETTSPIAFMQNYESMWVGAGENALVAIDKIQSLRYEEIKPILKSYKNEEYIIAMDVARSESKSNNQSAYVIGRLNRSKNGNVRNVDIVNIHVPQNGLTFRQQTIILKRLQKMYGATMCIVDANGLGSGIIDEVIHEQYDTETGETFDCWGVLNTDHKPDVPNAPKLVYAMNATGINNNIIINFWDYIESAKVRFLVSERYAKYDDKTTPFDEKVKLLQAHAQTDMLVEELSNLKVEKEDSGKFKLKRVTKKIDKDRYSALAYLLYYIQNFENKKSHNQDITDYWLD